MPKGLRPASLLTAAVIATPCRRSGCQRIPDEGVVIGACIVSAATATEVGATGVRRQPWANAPFTPGSLGEYMDAQFVFFNSDKIADDKRPILAGLNYFLSDEARGGQFQKIAG